MSDTSASAIHSKEWFSLRDWQMALLLLAATLLVYVPAMRGGYVWDDDDRVINNSALKEGAEGLRKIWFDVRSMGQYYPLAFSSFWLEYEVWGLWSTGSHIVNVLLHAASALLLWRLLEKLQVPGAWLAAFIFALHPVEVESVGWITERKNALSGTFYLLAALAYFRFQPLPPEQATEGRDWRFYPLVVLLFLCALLSKSVTCTLPVVLLVVLWWKQDRVGWRGVAPLIPLLVLGAGLGLLTAWMEKDVCGAKGQDWSLTVAERVLIAGRALWFYVGKLAWPAHLAFFYERWSLDAHVWWQWLFPTSAVGLAGLLWGLRARIGKGPLAAAVFFAVTLFPALGFFDVYPFRYSFVADHFQYLASIGPIALAAAGVTLAARRFGEFPPLLWPVLGTLLLCTLGVLTWQQGRMYADLETFYRTAIKCNPECWMAYNNLGIILAGRGETEAAMVYYHKALELKPDNGETYNNIGIILIGRGRLDEAIANYRKALELTRDFAEAHNNLGDALAARGELAAAIAEYEKALAIIPDYATAHNNLGNALAGHKEVDAALAHFQKALEINPDYAEAHNNLAALLIGRGEVDAAIGHYLDPESVTLFS